MNAQDCFEGLRPRFAGFMNTLHFSIKPSSFHFSISYVFGVLNKAGYMCICVKLVRSIIINKNVIESLTIFGDSSFWSNLLIRFSNMKSNATTNEMKNAIKALGVVMNVLMNSEASPSVVSPINTIISGDSVRPKTNRKQRLIANRMSKIM